jgi:hypothetical protein
MLYVLFEFVTLAFELADTERRMISHAGQSVDWLHRTTPVERCNDGRVFLKPDIV